VQINATLAAELAVLTETLDDPGTDIVESLRRLIADAGTAVRSFLGLTVVLADSDPPMTFTVLENGVHAGQIGTSLMLTSLVRAQPDTGHDRGGPRVALILYAGVPGAFVDLAADLSWMTGPSTGPKFNAVLLDEYLTPSAGTGPGTNLRAASVINQAIGVLIGRGNTHEQAYRELDARAQTAGTDRQRAADLILAALACLGVDPDLDIA